MWVFAIGYDDRIDFRTLKKLSHNFFSLFPSFVRSSSVRNDINYFIVYNNVGSGYIQSKSAER